jgi:hypothetical protein
MGFTADEMLEIRLERHVIEQFKAPNGDAVLRQIHPKVLPAWPLDSEEGQVLLQRKYPLLEKIKRQTRITLKRTLYSQNASVYF